jgi:hypothetical protein
MSTPLNHARHNKEACEHLNAVPGKFPDWVVTTAFYCAMHYAHAVIFPYTEVGVTYRNLEEYFNKHKRTGDTKHSVTLDLIRKLHSSIADKYKQLKDTAHTARYHDYELPQPVVSKMRKNLKVIEEYCEAKCLQKTT